MDDEFYPPNIEDYKYSQRQMYYSTERFEVSPDEAQKIESITKTKVSPIRNPVTQSPINVIIDTDIGTDLDDSLAILYALHLPNIRILGITTMYGPSKLRAAIAQKICDAYWAHHPDAPRFPIIAGASLRMGTHRRVFLAGNEGRGLFTDSEIEELANEWHDPSKYLESQYNAADFINQTASENPGLKIISIGIPTNLGLALKKNPNLPNLIDEVVIMGGGSFITSGKLYSYDNDPKRPPENTLPQFPLPNTSREALQFLMDGKPVLLYPNHNLSGDTLASKILFDAQNLKISIVDHEVTSKFWLCGEVIDYLKNSAETLSQPNHSPAAVVGTLLNEWFRVRRFGNNNGQCPHDPLTVHEAVFGGKDKNIVYVPGTFVLHEWAAFGTFIPHSDGKHFLGVNVLYPNAFLKHLSDTLMMKD